MPFTRKPHSTIRLIFGVVDQLKGLEVTIDPIRILYNLHIHKYNTRLPTHDATHLRVSMG